MLYQPTRGVPAEAGGGTRRLSRRGAPLLHGLRSVDSAGAFRALRAPPTVPRGESASRGDEDPWPPSRSLHGGAAHVVWALRVGGARLALRILQGGGGGGGAPDRLLVERSPPPAWRRRGTRCPHGVRSAHTHDRTAAVESMARG